MECSSRERISWMRWESCILGLLSFPCTCFWNCGSCSENWGHINNFWNDNNLLGTILGYNPTLPHQCIRPWLVWLARPEDT
jgi:hypothetical protein